MSFVASTLRERKMFYSFRNRKPSIGKETYVSEHAFVVGDVKIGDNCYIGHGAILRGDYGSIEIDSGTAVEEGVVIHAPPNDTCRIGKNVTIGHGAIIHSSSIGDFAVIGMGAVVSIYAEVGKEAIVAEGSVVKMRQKVPSGVVVGGNPAKTVREITDEDKRFWGWGKQLYVELAREYIQNGMKKLDSSTLHKNHTEQ
jgi:carbonic anhydrase/acetyltransferase-like protein (isoleucine patch superfamily)